MRPLIKGPEPVSLATHRASNGDWSSAYRTVKDDVRIQLGVDQFGMCAYCEQHLGSPMDVDHIHPWTKPACDDPANQPETCGWSVMWANLAGTCDVGASASGCNRRKGSLDLCLKLVNPYRFPTSFSTSVRRDGTVHVDGIGPMSESTDTFLNHQVLVGKRADFIREIEQQVASGSSPEELVDAYRGTRQFVSTLAAVLGGTAEDYL
jgi:hypothetical protein